VVPHVNAAFINALAEEGTRDELIAWLQAEWSDNCALGKQIAASTVIPSAVALSSD
jgi:hypothetical protein